jgi:hypothetical protein
MRTLLTTLAVLLSVPACAVPGPQINGNQINPQSGISISTLTVTGTQGLAVTGPASAASFSGSGGAITHLTAANVDAGTLGPQVIASSVAATAVISGSYGSGTVSPTLTVGGDGRLTAAGSATITPGAGSITAGTLGPAVIASSVAATAVTAGTYGASGAIPVLTIAGDGRITSATTATPVAAKFVQLVSTQTTAYMSGTNTIPWDDTIPQITEGWQVLSTTVTATLATNNMRISVNLWGAEVSDTGNEGVMCVFKDAGANAIGCVGNTLGTQTGGGILFTIDFSTPSVDTSAHVFSVRFGEDVGTTEVNGKGGSRKLGGAGVTAMKVEEVVP